MDKRNLDVDYEMAPQVQSPSNGVQADANRGQESQFSPPPTQGPSYPPPPAYYHPPPQANQYAYTPGPPPPGYAEGATPYPYVFQAGYGGTPQYPQPPPPGFAYPPTGAPLPQQQQQQQVVIVGGQPQTNFVIQPTGVSMIGAIIFSCFAFWCCGYLFGGIAFIIAVVGESSRDDKERLRLRRASLGLSIAAFVLGVIAIAIIVGVMVSSINSSSSSSSSSAQTQYCYTSYNSIYRTSSYTCNG